MRLVNEGTIFAVQNRLFALFESTKPEEGDQHCGNRHGIGSNRGKQD